MFGIGLTLDARTGARTCDLWRVLEEARVGNDSDQLGLSPYVAFSLFTDGDRAVLATLVDVFEVTDSGPGPIPFGASRREKPTPYSPAVPSPDQVRAHGAHVALVRACGLSCDPLYTPGEHRGSLHARGGDRGGRSPDQSRDVLDAS